MMEDHTEKNGRKAAPHARRWKRWGLLLLVLAGLAVAASLLLDHVVRQRLQEAAGRAAGPGYTVRLGSVDTHILQGSVEVLDASLTFDSLRTDSLLAGTKGSLIRAKAARIKVEGLSYRRLLWDRAVVMRAVEITGPVIDHYFKPVRHETDSTKSGGKATTDVPPLFTLDTLRILGARGGTHDLSGERTSASVAELDILSGGIIVAPSGRGNPLISARSTTLLARGVKAAFPPLYDLQIGTLELVHPAGIARATMASFSPRADEQHYGTLVEHETDLFHAKVDTLLLAGVEIDRLLAMQELFVRRADLRAPLLLVYRDKTLPDGPFKRKNLPPEGLRNLDRTIRIDTIAIHGGRVDYNERDSLNQDYGMVSFAELNAVLTGMGNTPDHQRSGELHLEADARVYDKSTIRVEYRAPLSPSTGSFTVDAHLRSLPFRAFNRMTDSLLMVKVNSGSIAELVLHMRGNDDHAQGTLDLVYDGLDMEIRSRDPRQPRTWLLNRALQLLVRRSNLRTAGNYRQGHFTVVRRKDRSIFNFAWRAVRSGTLDSMVPGALSKYAQDRSNKRTREQAPSNAKDR